MIIDDLKRIKPLSASEDTDLEDYTEDEGENQGQASGDVLGTIIRDVAEYDQKIDILRAYIGYYSEYDLEMMFDTTSLIDILTNYTYNQIRARLVNTKSNTLEADFDIGDIVEIVKPVLRYNIYEHDEGVIIGKHLVFDDKDKNRSPLYHTQYDILVQSDQYIDGFAYEIKRERARDLVLKEHTIEEMKDIMNEFASYQIEKNV